MPKTVELTLVGPACRRSAVVSLVPPDAEATDQAWSAEAVVEDPAGSVRHAVEDQVDERSALMAIAQWLLDGVEGPANDCAGGSMLTFVAVARTEDAA